ncbi:MAG TPA: sigma factor-like helix-turn-helix DNA-binding protein [Gemmatimonadaceae bacterium]|nr:sigma factor-like helix-turn-helix DNA-binding protein [Gemmatimonadaceae bacterium]
MPPSMDRDTGEAVFRRNLQAIDRISATLCERHGLRGAEAEQFASIVRHRLAANDYAIVRTFRDDESLLPHLMAVSGALLREFRVKRDGAARRPSASIRPPGVGLARALDALPAEDRTIVQMHLLDGMSVSDIARALGLEEAPLRQRIEGLVGQIRLSGETPVVPADRAPAAEESRGAAGPA